MEPPGPFPKHWAICGPSVSHCGPLSPACSVNFPSATMRSKSSPPEQSSNLGGRAERAEWWRDGKGERVKGVHRETSPIDLLEEGTYTKTIQNPLGVSWSPLKRRKSPRMDSEHRKNIHPSSITPLLGREQERLGTWCFAPVEQVRSTARYFPQSISNSTIAPQVGSS